jgi:aminoglycoside phosphotransferase (APT) family kinase protein
LTAMQTKTPIATGRTAEVFAWGDTLVLKLFRPEWGMDTATHEAEVARALYAAGVAAPRVDNVIAVDGRAGVVYERIAGPSLMGTLAARPWRLRGVARLLGETHASMHERTVSGLPQLREILARRIQVAPGLPTALQRAALDVLNTLPDGETLCHGDFHPGNVLLSVRGPLVIDWENAALGDPLADVARTVLLIRASHMDATTPAQRLLRRALASTLMTLYLRRYRQLHPFDQARLAAWELPITAARLSEGIEAEEAYLLARVRQLAATPRG